jgi:type II secretion system protein G
MISTGRVLNGRGRLDEGWTSGGTMSYRSMARGFTLVEILIVVVILGILSAIVVPQFSHATQDSKEQATLSQLRHLRNAVAVYGLQHNNHFPDISEGEASWGELQELGYLKAHPVNHYVGGNNAKLIVFGDGAPESWSSDYGWIYRPAGDGFASPDIWAAGFDENDDPISPE